MSAFRKACTPKHGSRLKSEAWFSTMGDSIRQVFLSVASRQQVSELHAMHRIDEGAPPAIRQ